MTVKTKTVANRRDLHYSSLDELVEDAERLAPSHTTVGNWTLPQILSHVSGGLNATVDGFSYSAPWPLRFILTLVMKKKFLKKMPAGLSIPSKIKKDVAPKEVPLEQALADLRTAVDRLKATDQRAPHPFFGKVSKDEAETLQLRHAELHMSFVHPA